MTEKRFAVTQTVLGSGIYDYQAENELCESYDEDAYREVCKKLNELNRLADGNEEQLLAVMTYLHDKYYDIWEEVNKECFND